MKLNNMDYNTAKAGLKIIISSGLLDKDYGIFQILCSDFVNNSEGFCDWGNRIYFSFLIGQIKDYFIKNPKYFLIYFKEEYPDVCKGPVLQMVDELIKTPEIKSSDLINIANVL